MNWKRLLIFSALSLFLSISFGMFFILGDLYSFERYPSATAALLVLYGPGVIISFAVFFWLAIGLKSRYYSHALLVFLVPLVASQSLNFAIFNTLFLNYIVLIEIFLGFICMVFGTHFGARFTANRKLMHENA